MRRRVAKALVRLYPRAWRERYGEEFAAFLEERREGAGAALNVIGSALRERVLATTGGAMEQIYSFGAVARKPSAVVPLTMSVLALSLVLGAIVYGVVIHHPLTREPGEGAIAHIWQLLMVVQVPVVLFFAIKWLRRAPRQTLGVLALQLVVWLAACAPVYLLHL